MTAYDRPRRWLITGVSSGLGRAIAVTALSRSDEVVGTVRTLAARAEFDQLSNRARAALVDVRDRHAVFALVDEVARDGPIDIVVNNAGIGALGAVEELSIDEIRDVFETNFFGTLNVVQAAIPHLRAQGSGHIVNVSSIMGFVGVAGSGAYSASKFALEGVTEALAAEMAPFGVRVSLVEPSAFATGGQAATRLASRTIAAYDETAGRARATVKNPNHPRDDPALVGDAVIRLVDSSSAPLRLPVGAVAGATARAKLRSWAEELEDPLAIEATATVETKS